MGPKTAIETSSSALEINCERWQSTPDRSHKEARNTQSLAHFVLLCGCVSQRTEWRSNLALDIHMKRDKEHQVEQLVMLANALASEIKGLRAELENDRSHTQQVGGINFYDEVERYEIELINSALRQCGGNQAQAAKLLHLKSTTLNAKMKHYGLNPTRSIT
jgi:DNA-binding protein Fis